MKVLRLLPAVLLAVLVAGFSPLLWSADSEGEAVTISVSSDEGHVPFSISLTSPKGFGFSSDRSTTPARFTVTEEQFDGAIEALGEARLTIDVVRGTVSASRSNTLAVNISREGGDIRLFGRSRE